MKKIILLVLFVSVSIISFGNTPAHFKDDNCTFKNKLEKQLRLPDYLKKKSNTGIVKVEFVINENDVIEIKNISGNNEAIKEYIKAQFAKMDSDVCSLEKNTTYFIDINFKIL